MCARASCDDAPSVHPYVAGVAGAVALPAASPRRALGFIYFDAAARLDAESQRRYQARLREQLGREGKLLSTESSFVLSAAAEEAQPPPPDASSAGRGAGAPAIPSNTRQEGGHTATTHEGAPADD